VINEEIGVSANFGRKIRVQVKKNFSAQVKFLSSLVKAKSANPHTPENSKKNEPIEAEVAELIVNKLNAIKVRSRRMGAGSKRKNVVCYWGPSRFRKSLILNGHMDTTVPGDNYKGDPFSGSVRGDRLYGVGAYDMKSSLSAFVYVVKALKDLGVDLDGRLILQFVVDEETGACSRWGTKYLLAQGVKSKVAIVAEPGTQIGIGHRGGYRFKLTTEGEAVHTGVSVWQRREKGRNAIVDMARTIAALQNLEIPFKSAKVFPNKKPIITFPTIISGGKSINVVPDKCEAYGDVRLMPGNSDRQVKIWIKEKLASMEGLKYEIKDLLFAPAMEIDEKEEIVALLKEEYEKVGKQQPVVEGIGPWNDAWMFAKKDIPAVTQMPLVGNGAHGDNEWISLRSLRQLTEVLMRVVVGYLGVRK